MLEHSNTTKYGNQLILVVEIDGYAICVPCFIERNGDFVMKKIYPSRKFSRMLLRRTGGEIADEDVNAALALSPVIELAANGGNHFDTTARVDFSD